MHEKLYYLPIDNKGTMLSSVYLNMGMVYHSMHTNTDCDPLIAQVALLTNDKT